MPSSRLIRRLYACGNITRHQLFTAFLPCCCCCCYHTALGSSGRGEGSAENLPPPSSRRREKVLGRSWSCLLDNFTHLCSLHVGRRTHVRTHAHTQFHLILTDPAISLPPAVNISQMPRSQSALISSSVRVNNECNKNSHRCFALTLFSFSMRKAGLDGWLDEGNKLLQNTRPQSGKIQGNKISDGVKKKNRKLFQICVCVCVGGG